MKEHIHTKKNKLKLKHKHGKSRNTGKTNKITKVNKSKKQEKYDNTYYIDSCFTVNAKNRWIFIDNLIKNLERIGLKEDPMMKKIVDLDMAYLRKHNILFDSEKCLSDYNIPQNFDKSKLKPSFVFMWTGSVDPRISSIKTKLCKYLYYPHFYNVLLKNELYFNMKKHFPEITKKHMANTFMINEFDKYEFPKNYILRPVYDTINNKFFRSLYFNNFASSKEELDEVVAFYEKYNHGYNVIASEYIMNPLLFRGKKCHLRMHHIISVINDKVYCFLYEIGRIFTAEEEYNTTDKPFTREVHLSIFGGTRRDLMFPKDFTDENLNVKGIDPKDVLRQMRMLLSCVAKLISNKGKKLLENHENGLNIGSVEFLVDDTGKVYLLEVNKAPGMAFHVKDIANEFIDNSFDWIATSVIEPCIKGTDPSKFKPYVTKPSSIAIR